MGTLMGSGKEKFLEQPYTPLKQEIPFLMKEMMVHFPQSACCSGF